MSGVTRKNSKFHFHYRWIYLSQIYKSFSQTAIEVFYGVYTKMFYLLSWQSNFQVKIWKMMSHISKLRITTTSFRKIHLYMHLHYIIWLYYIILHSIIFIILYIFLLYDAIYLWYPSRLWANLLNGNHSNSLPNWFARITNIKTFYCA